MVNLRRLGMALSDPARRCFPGNQNLVARVKRSPGFYGLQSILKSLGLTL